MLIQGGVEDLRHAVSGQIARGLFSGGAPAARPSIEGRQPEPAASVAGCGPGWNGLRRCGEDQIVEAGPDREKDGVVRWRQIDLKRVIAERFGVDFHQRCVGKLLQKLGFSHISARPRHPAQDERFVEAFKKTSRSR